MGDVMWRLLIITVALWLTACTTVPLQPDVVRDDPDYAPVSAQALEPPPISSGSLYQSRYSFGLFTDQQARKVGDIITVVFDERYRSQKSAETSTDKSSNARVQTGSFLGMVPGLGNMSLDADVQADRSFSGSGDADRSNSLTGRISVSVAEILPNGILRIRGEKWLNLSEGEEFIRIRGLVRPQDISPENIVLSSKVADARISFGGAGSLNNATKEGWGSRLLNSPWFPF